ncbi:MAG: hypothetical protein NT149_04655 [Candidatus Gottesmanbacteria bacterium]|nr:hypothetical protein [Candidatus Gottesmanbacteria bacterium]
MNKSLLVTRPNYDSATHYLYRWTEPVIAEAKRKHIPVYDLKEDKATKKTFLSYVQSKHPGFLFLNGHGDAFSVGGHDDEVILDKKIDTGALLDCIMYARSCDSGKVLGNTLVGRGVLAFIGYTRKFIVGTTRSKITKPLEDQLAKLFLEPSNLIATTILKGHSAGEADRRSKQAMLKKFGKMISSIGSFEERFAARWLWSDIRSQVVIGDHNASIHS